MNRPEISIVVPVYNIEKYIAQCIESVINQTNKNECEIILIDDGSTDSSGIICDSYSDKYINIKTIHQKNAGVCVARNTGINIAQGDYIVFLDGDDFWNDRAVEILNKIILKKPDMGIFSAHKYIDGKIGDNISSSVIPNGENGKLYLDNLMKSGNEFIPYTWLYIFRTEFLKMNNIIFTPGLQVCEDFEFNLKCLDKAISVYGSSGVVVNYRIRNGSLTASVTYEKLMINLKMKSNAYRCYKYSGFADMYLWTVLQISRVSNIDDINEIKNFLSNNKDIEKFAKKKSLRIGYYLIRIFGYEKGSRLYLKLSKLKS